MNKLLIGLFLLLLSSNAKGQFLPPNQPEQDACHALVLCGLQFHSPYTYQGNGYVNDLINTPCGISGLSAGENNSVWLRLEINTSGTLIFKITPLAAQDDYDWAVLDVTNKDCHNLSSSDVVRCNFNNNQPVSNNGITGLTLSAIETGVTAGTTGHPYCKYINAQAGQVYLIMINNFGVLGQGLTSGFTIDFTGSSATFNMGDPPAFQSLQTACTVAQGLTLQLTKPVACNSIAANGSDFYVTPSGAIGSATGVNCNANGTGYTDEITISFNPPLAPGSYQLHAQSGTDGNTLLDLCGNALVLPDQLAFTVPDLSSEVALTICSNQLPYQWNGQVVTSGGNNAAQATFPSQNGCDSVVTLNLEVVDTITYIENITICPEELPYVWNGITLTAGGQQVASYTTVSAGGCDSVTLLNLTVQQAVTHNYTLEGCGSVTFNGQTYTQSENNVKDTIVSTGGCDSVYATLNVTVHPVDTTTVNTDVAGCGFVDYQGTHYTTSTTLRDTIKNQFGCDSLYQVTHIIVYPNVPETVSHDRWGCDSVVFEGNTYRSETVLIDTFKNGVGCDSMIRTVNIHPQHFTLGLSADPQEPVEGVLVTLSTSSNAPSYRIHSWEPQSQFVSQTALSQHFLATVSTVYTVVGESNLGCIDTAELVLTIDSLIPRAIMPSAFSPNGDGLNDVFKPNFFNKTGYKINTFKVFNRYGQIIFDFGGIRDAGWNGNYFNRDKPAETGVYYYYIEVEFVDGTKRSIRGDVTLIR